MGPTFDANPLVEMDTPGVFFDTGNSGAGGRKGMLQIALKLKQKTVAAIKNLAASIITGLTGNANFPSPSPTPAELQAAIDDVTAEEGAMQAALDHVEVRRNALAAKVETLSGLLRAIAANCQDKVKNDDEAMAKAKLLSANLPLKAEATVPDPLERPQNFQVSQGDHSGSVDGMCDRDKNAKMYRVRCGTSPSGPFETKYKGTKSSFTISGHPLGPCWLQIQAFGTNGGWSEWSDPAFINVV